jgi:hypothetical protein
MLHGSRRFLMKCFGWGGVVLMLGVWLTGAADAAPYKAPPGGRPAVAHWAPVGYYRASWPAYRTPLARPAYGAPLASYPYRPYRVSPGVVYSYGGFSAPHYLSYPAWSYSWSYSWYNQSRAFPRPPASYNWHWQQQPPQMPAAPPAPPKAPGPNPNN